MNDALFIVLCQLLASSANILRLRGAVILLLHVTNVIAIHIGTIERSALSAACQEGGSGGGGRGRAPLQPHGHVHAQRTVDHFQPVQLLDSPPRSLHVREGHMGKPPRPAGFSVAGQVHPLEGVLPHYICQHFLQRLLVHLEAQVADEH